MISTATTPDHHARREVQSQVEHPPRDGYQLRQRSARKVAERRHRGQQHDDQILVHSSDSRSGRRVAVSLPSLSRLALRVLPQRQPQTAYDLRRSQRTDKTRPARECLHRPSVPLRAKLPQQAVPPRRDEPDHAVPDDHDRHQLLQPPRTQEVAPIVLWHEKTFM